MRDEDCVAFLQWALPRLRLRWSGYRKVRRQVCKRIRRRVDALGITLDEYRERVSGDPAERQRLDGYCQITISRFYRDRATWQRMEQELLPTLAHDILEQGRCALCAWSIGCASGEEPYTLALLWTLQLSGLFPGIDLDILATERQAAMLERAEHACYAGGSLKDLPTLWRAVAFEYKNGEYCLAPQYRTQIRLLEHDARNAPPAGRFDLILCRYLVFTYFEENLQREILDRLTTALRPGGVLVLGTHESLPQPHPEWEAIGWSLYVYHPS
jgi:chemotaxis protein methyltransferase CheR